MSVTAVGLLSRIVVRKPGRRAAEGKQAVPVRAPDGEVEGGAAAADNDGDVSLIAADAAAAREQFPFIFNLLRGHAIGAREPAPRPASGADNRRSKTSRQQQPQQQHHQQLMQPPPRRPAAVATCRQRPAAFSSRGTRAPPPFIPTMNNRQILELVACSDTWYRAERTLR